MPSSKKPRKRMRRVYQREVMDLNPQTIEAVRDIFAKTSLAVALKLHTGECTFDDMACMRDMFNLATASLALRGQTFDPDYEAEAKLAVIEKGFSAWCEVYTRGKEDDHYICNAGQLAAIREAFVYIDALIEYSLEACPMTLMREWFGVKSLMQQAHAGRVKISIPALKKAVQTSCIDMASARYVMNKYRAKLTPRMALQ